MFPPSFTAVAQARIDDLHRQAQRDALAHAARRARTHQHGHRASGLLAAVARWARRRNDTTGWRGVTRPAPARPEHEARVQAHAEILVTTRSRS